MPFLKLRNTQVGALQDSLSAWPPAADLEGFSYSRLGGLDMPAHRFRHAAAKIYLDRHPGEYELIRQLLGHKDKETTIAFYSGAESASAARYYARTILEIRAGSLGLEARHG